MDADIRAKEPVIREDQFAKVRAHIALLETGVIPPDDSRAVTLGELVRGLCRALRTKC